MINFNIPSLFEDQKTLIQLLWIHTAAILTLILTSIIQLSVIFSLQKVILQLLEGVN